MDETVKSESSNNLYRLFLPSSPCRVVKWVVSPGARVRKGTILMTYMTDLSTSEPADELPLKSTLVGVVKERMYEEGEIVKPGNPVVVLEERCDHSIVVFDMCTDCGRNLRSQTSDRGGTSEGGHATVTVVHGIPGIRISQKEAEVLGREDKLRLLKSRKLALIVDLDQTLIHTSVDPNIEPGLQDVYGFKLPGQPVLYHCRLRPFAREFLERISKQYEMHVFTMGTNSYAASITKILDPGKKLFCDRIISRDECFDPFSKAPRLKSVFPCGDEMVAIIDDREDVWSRCPNLIHVKPYVFFAGTADINAPPPRPSSPPTSSSTTTTDTPDCLPFKTRHMTAPSNKPKVTIPTTTKHHQSPLVNSTPPSSKDNDITDSTTSVTEDKATSNSGDRTSQPLASAPGLESEKDMQGVESMSHIGTNSSKSTQISIERTEQTDETPSVNLTSEGDNLNLSALPTVQGNANSNNNNGEEGGDPKTGEGEGDSSSSSSSDSSSEGEDEGQDGEVKGHEGEDKGHEGDAEGGDGSSSSSSSDSSGIDDDLFDSLEENVEDTEIASDRGGSAEGVELKGVVELNKDKVTPMVATGEERVMEVREEGESVDIVSKATGKEEVNKGKVELGGNIPVNNEGSKGNLPDEMETDSPPSTAPTTTFTPPQSNNIIQKSNTGRRRSIEVKDPDNFLVYLGDILTLLHDRFYKEFDNMVEGIDIEQVDKIPTPDLKRLIPDIRHSVLKGTRILFTGVIPTNMPPIKNREWNTARAFGAIIHDRLVPGLHSTDPAKACDATTHVIAGRPGTSKLKEAKRLPGVKIVSTKWLWACAEQWRLVDERSFPPVFEKEKEDEGHQGQSSKDNGKGKSKILKPPRKTMKVITENSEEVKAVPTTAMAPPTTAMAPPTQEKAQVEPTDSEPTIDEVSQNSGTLGSTEKDAELDSDSDSDDDAFNDDGKMDAADFERDPAMLQRLREFKRHMSLESRLSVSDEELEKMDAEVEAEISSSSDSGENLGTFIEEKDDDTLLSYESYAGSDHDASNCERTGSIVERQSRKRKHIDIENNSSSSNSPAHEHLNDSIEPSDDENFDSDNDSNDSVDELGALLG